MASLSRRARGPARRPHSNGRAPCPAPGTPTRPTTPRDGTRLRAASWVGVGLADDVAAPGELPRHLRRAGARPRRRAATTACCAAFLNVCRHRGSPIARGRGLRPRAAVPVPRRGCTGSTARWRAPGESARPTAFDPADFGLKQISVTTFGRSLLVNLDPDAAPLDVGRLGHAVDPFGIDEFEVVAPRPLRVRVQLEGAARELLGELPHAVRPLAASGRRLRVPDRDRGSRRLRVGSAARATRRVEQALHDCASRRRGLVAASPSTRRPSRSTTAATSRSWPNTMLSVFSGFAATFRLTPSSPDHHGRRARLPLAPVRAATTAARPTTKRPAASSTRTSRCARRCSARTTVAARRTACSPPSTRTASRTCTGCSSRPWTARSERYAGGRACARLHATTFASPYRARSAPPRDPRRRLGGRARARLREHPDRRRRRRRSASAPGLIHYHFASKDELLARDAAARRGGRHPPAREVGRRKRRPDRAVRPRAARVPAEPPRRPDAGCSGSTPGRPVCAIPCCREISEELDEAWVRVLEGVIEAGVDAGTFRLPRSARLGVAPRVAARRSRPAGGPAQLDDEAQPDARARAYCRRTRAGPATGRLPQDGALIDTHA